MKTVSTWSLNDPVNHNNIEESIQKMFGGSTTMEWAYDQFGRFSHLVARVSYGEFIQLHSANVASTIFIQGHWLQLCFRGKQKLILNKTLQTTLRIEFGSDYLQRPVLELHSSEKECEICLKRTSPERLLLTESGHMKLAKLAMKVFCKRYTHLTAQHTDTGAKLPTVHVLPSHDASAHGRPMHAGSIAPATQPHRGEDLASRVVLN